MEHKEAITADDLENIRRYFDHVLDVGDQVKLTHFCRCHLSIHFVLRSKEIQTTIRKSDIVFETDSEGKEYASLRRDFLAKNCPGGIKGLEYESCGRLQEPREVEALKKLLAKLHPGVERLFQRGLKGNQLRKQANMVYEGTPGPHRPRRHVATNKRSGSPFPKVHKSLSSSDKRRYLEGFRFRRPSCMLPDRAQKPAKPRKLCRSSENEKQALARALDGKMCKSRDVEDSSSSLKAVGITTSCSRQDSFAFKNSVIHNLTINIKSEGDAS